jgi:hypothetical protein
MPWKRRFLPATAVAAVLWGLYASGLGYIGGASFEHNLWLPMLIGAGASFLVGGVGELVRRKVLARDPHQEAVGRTPGGDAVSAKSPDTAAAAATSREANG